MPAGSTRRCPIFPGPVLAYCRTGHPLDHLWAWPRARGARHCQSILAATKAAGYDMSGVVRRIANGGKTPTDVADFSHDIVIIGGGSAGISVASSLLARASDLDIAIIDPQDVHYYQPGWTMVGGGIFEPRSHGQAPWDR
jgi:sulfide:quinone oxidoreductase